MKKYSNHLNILTTVILRHVFTELYVKCFFNIVLKCMIFKSHSRNLFLPICPRKKKPQRSLKGSRPGFGCQASPKFLFHNQNIVSSYTLVICVSQIWKRLSHQSKKLGLKKAFSKESYFCAEVKLKACKRKLQV